MAHIEMVVKAGYEEIHNIAVARLNNLEEEIRAEVEARLAPNKERLEKIINECLEEIEVEDIEEPVEEACATDDVAENVGE